jgi:prepilin-type N-terminal cleavage/methylation domain-containing protein
MKINLNNKGFSLLELMLALAIFVVSIASISHLFVGSRAAVFYNLNKTQALFLAKEGIEEQRALKKINGIRNLENTSDSITLGDDTFDRTVSVDFIDWNQAEITSTVDFSYLGTDDQISYSETLTTWNLPEYSLDFDGVDDSVNVPDDSSHNVDYITVSFWAKWNSSTGQHDLIIKDYADRSFVIYMLDADTLRFWTMVGDSWITDSYDVSFSPTLGDWYHIVGTKSADYQRLYINNVEEYEASHPGVLDKGSAITFGGGGYGYFDGELDDIRIYDRALSEEEIDDLYSGKNITSGLVAYWPMDENVGCSVLDESSNSNDGSLLPDCAGGNAPVWEFRE